MSYIYGLTIIGCMYITAASTVLGLDWIEQGHGLNPFVAFPLAIIASIISVICTHRYAEEMGWK